MSYNEINKQIKKIKRQQKYYRNKWLDLDIKLSILAHRLLLENKNVKKKEK